MSFYGYESAPEFARVLYAELLHCWSKETCAPRYRADWSPQNPTLGHCSITSFIVQDLMGGEVNGIPLKDGGYHCFNAADGCVFDLTSEQFGGRQLDYSDFTPQSREAHFADADKLARYELLKSRLLERLAARGVK